ncbi:hypothetical protein [Oceanithermus sp.]
MKRTRFAGAAGPIKTAGIRVAAAALVVVLGLSACNLGKTNTPAAKNAAQSGYVRITVEDLTKNPDAARALQRAITENGGGDLETLVREGKVYVLEKRSP